MNTTAVTQPSKKPQTLREAIEGEPFRLALTKVLPKHLTAERFTRIAISAMSRNPKLAECDRHSFFGALMQLSQWGLEPDGRRAHLIPFENRKRGLVECQVVIDYKGLVELVINTGLVSYVHADVVCEQDEFEFDKGELVHHRIDFRQPRGAIYAAYSICRFKDCSEKAIVMAKEEIEAVRSRSRSAQNGPWVTDWAEMAKKTVFRRLTKWLPLSGELRDAVEHDGDEIEERRFEAAKPVFDRTPNGTDLLGITQERTAAPLPPPEPDEPEPDEINTDPAPKPQPPEEPIAPEPPTSSAPAGPPVLGEHAKQVQAILDQEGFSFTELQRWAAVKFEPRFPEWGSLFEVPEVVCRRLVRSRVGLVNSMREKYGIAPVAAPELATVS